MKIVDVFRSDASRGQWGGPARQTEPRAGPPRQLPTRLTALTALRMAPRLPSLAADYDLCEYYYVVSTSTVAKNLSLGSRGAEEPAKNLRLSSRALRS